MKKFFTFAAVAVAVFFAGNSANAQLSVEGGYNFQATHIEMGAMKADTAFNGIYAGVNYTQNLVGNLSITPGVFLGFNTFSEKTAGIKYSWDQLGVMIPVTINYCIRLHDEFRLKIMVGPQFDFGLVSQITNDKNSNKVDMYNKDDFPAELSRFDVSGLVGIRFEFYKFFVRTHFALGLTDVAKNDNVKMSNGRLLVGFGYTF